jgi:hypothetical protein
MIEQSYIDRIYARLSAMDVELDADPIEFGPSRLNLKVAEVRGHLSSTEKIFMEVSHNLQKVKRELLIAQTEYTMEQSSLIANDPHVRSGRSQKEREALAGTRLVDKQILINQHTLSVHDLEDLMLVIKAKRTDLKDLQGRLRDQLKLCQEEIALGKRWGTKSRTFTEVSKEVTTSDLVDAFMGYKESDLEEALSRSPIKTDVLEQVTTPEGSSVEKIALDQVDVNNLDDIDLDDIFSKFGT